MIGENMRSILVAVSLALFATAASAQTVQFYSPNGQHAGSSTTIGNTTTFYGPNGSRTGSATTIGNTTTFYGPNGQREGSSTVMRTAPSIDRAFNFKSR
jgi:hypothetical protein